MKAQKGYFAYDLARSKWLFREKVWRGIREWDWFEGAELSRDESDLLDKQADTDCLVALHDGGVVNVGYRVQDARSFGTFTIRYWRFTTKYDTQYFKIVRAIDAGTIYPRYTVHAYWEKDRDWLTAFGVETAPLFGYLERMRGSEPERFREHIRANGDDGNTFVFISVDELNFHGIETRDFCDGIGGFITIGSRRRCEDCAGCGYSDFGGGCQGCGGVGVVHERRRLVE
jgi:hypothetical protein